METRDRWLVALGVAALAAVGTAAVFHASGTVDRPDSAGPGPGIPDPGSPALVERRRPLPFLDLPPGYPEAAAKSLREAHRVLVAGTEQEAREALRRLAPESATGPLAGCAAETLEALAPTLARLDALGEGTLPAAALRTAAALARVGGAGGRAALERTGLLRDSFASRAVDGPVEDRREAARLLGLVGGKDAVAWLVRLVERAPEPDVRREAILAMGGAFQSDRTLPPAAVAAVMAALADPAAPVALRRDCLVTARAAYPVFASTDVAARAAAVLDDPLRDRGLRAAAAELFERHPVAVGGPALVRAMEDPDDSFVLHVANALARIRPPGAAEALARRRGTVKDAEALQAVDRALEQCRPK
jgi:HEAT repeat protein